jgi:hypothetical protein
MIWESRNDTKNRKELRGVDFSKYGIGELGTWGVAKREATLWVADRLTRIVFQTFAHAGGLHGYHLPDMDKIASVAHGHYNNDLRGGEGHMGVGKLIQNVVMSKARMTLSVKPFGCMPSAGVSDGVQSLISEKFPGTIFCAVETSGDGRVNFYCAFRCTSSRPRPQPIAELERVCVDQGVTLEQVRAFLDAHPRMASGLSAKPPHAAAGSAADIVMAVAPPHDDSRERTKKVAEHAVKTGAEVLRHFAAGNCDDGDARRRQGPRGCRLDQGRREDLTASPRGV